MKAQYELIEAFREGATRGTASNMFVEGDTLYSYGHHFPLVERYGLPSGYKFLINADRYSLTTSQHQSRVFHLGPLWHEAVKNLAVASWNAEGMVD